jgi:hypothetical protein
LDVKATTMIKGNWNAVDHAVRSSETLSGTLPNSLYLSSKPSWFGTLAWPPFDPSSPNQDYEAIPAGYRYVHNAEVPTTPTSSPTPTPSPSPTPTPGPTETGFGSFPTIFKTGETGGITIQFHLAHSDHVTLDIYDRSGLRVMKLLDEDRPAGDHSSSWNGLNQSGDSVASGVYLLTLKTGNQRQTKKIILIK